MEGGGRGNTGEFRGEGGEGIVIVLRWCDKDNEGSSVVCIWIDR